MADCVDVWETVAIVSSQVGGCEVGQDLSVEGAVSSHLGVGISPPHPTPDQTRSKLLGRPGFSSVFYGSAPGSAEGLLKFCPNSPHVLRASTSSAHVQMTFSCGSDEVLYIFCSGHPDSDPTKEGPC